MLTWSILANLVTTVVNGDDLLSRLHTWCHHVGIVHRITIKSINGSVCIVQNYILM